MNATQIEHIALGIQQSMNKGVFLFFFFAFAMSVAAQNHVVILGLDTISNTPDPAVSDSIAKAWQKEQLTEGYLAASYVKKANATFLNQGKHYNYSSIKGLDTLPLSDVMSKKELKRLRSETFSYEDVANIAKARIEADENAGHPFSTVRFEPELIEDEIHLTPHWNKGPLILIDSLAVKSKDKLNSKLIGKLLSVREGTPYREVQIETLNQTVQQFPFLKATSSPAFLFDTTKTVLYVYLEKAAANRFNGILGLQQDPISENTVITGEIDLQLVNVLNRAEDLRFHWRRIQQNVQQLEAGIKYPYLLNSNLSLAGSIDLYRRDSTFSTTELRAELGYLFSFRKSVSGFVEQWRSNSINSFTPNTQDVDIQRYGVKLDFEQFDSRINPFRGYQLYIESSAGIKEVPETETSESFTGEQYQTEVMLRHLQPIRGRLALGSTFQAAKIWDNSANLGLNEIYRIGGLNSLRGFNEEQFFASEYLIFNAELLFKIDRGTSIFGFFNQGWYEQRLAEVFSDQPYGFGFGLNLGTKSGQFKLISAVGSQNDEPILFRNARLHFGFVNLF